MTKKELRQYFNISQGTLSNLLNEKYYKELEPLGYEKRKQIVPPLAVKRFIEIYGKTVKLKPEEL